MTAIGHWNPAWGSEPRWQGPGPKQTRKPKNKALRLRCPNRCIEDVVTIAQEATYCCSSCNAKMVVLRDIKERVRPTVVQPGDRYGRLVVMSVIPGTKEDKIKAQCVCDCGTTKVVLCCHLRAGSTRSCGCLHRDMQAAHPWRGDFR